MRRRGLLLLALAVSVGACKDDEIVVEKGLTGVELTVGYAAGDGLDQLLVTGTLTSSAAAFEPAEIPETPAPLTAGENSVVLLLPEALDGEVVSLRIDGLRRGAIAATEREDVTIQAKSLVAVRVQLGAPAVCGDGMVRAGFELCDDANAAAGDGCNAACTIEEGWTCDGTPSRCARCGNGVVEAPEACDDADLDDLDGCSSGCRVEHGWRCSGALSTCTSSCGDSLIALGAEACDDGDGLDGDGCSAACSIEPGYTCVEEPSICTCDGDVDLDGTPDCDDTCLDADGDDYGEPGGGGDTCLGLDCDDTVATCALDCTTDADLDTTVDCADTCLDADGDGYGDATDAGDTCVDLDCDDTVATCALDCTTDADADSTFDCADTCLDADGDGYGDGTDAGNTCIDLDCADTVATCALDCVTDADADSTVDCADACLDADGDDYGDPGGAGNTCLGVDCNDTSETCNLDCTTDADADLVVDCLDTCIDADGDNYGAPGIAGSTCTALDCNDAVATCTVDCLTDEDGDGTEDCADGCLDADGDGYGTPGSAAVNTCLGLDCNDTRAACTLDCTGCLPAFLNLSAQTPVPLCGVSTLTIDLDAYDGAAAELACTSPPTRVFGLTNFETGREEWTSVSSVLRVELRQWPNSFPTPSCSSLTSGDFIRFDQTFSSWMQLGAPADMSGLGNLVLRFIAGYRNNPAGNDVLTVSACCGAGCTPAVVGTVDNDNSGGTDDCSLRTIALPSILDDCGELMIRFDWPSSSGYAGVDEIEIEGEVLFTPIVPGGGTGLYTTSISSCRPATFDPICTWDNQMSTPRSGTTSVTFQ